MTEEDKIILGHEARQILGSKLVRDAFAAIEKDAIEKLIASAPDDDMIRYRLAERIKVIREVKDFLTSTTITAQQAANKLGMEF